MQNLYHYTFLIFLFGLLSFSAQSQHKDDLKQGRDAMKKKINETETNIKKTEAARKENYDQFLELQRVTTSKQALIQSLEREIEIIDARILRQQDIVLSLSADLAIMQERYGALLRKTYRESHYQQPQLLFLLSAANFNDMVLRWRFLKQFYQYKNREVELVRKTQAAFEQQQLTLTTLKTERSELIAATKNETQQLHLVMDEKQTKIKELSKAEKKLKVKLKQQEKQKEHLNTEIQEAIAAENREKMAAARSNTALSRKKTAENTTLGNSFQGAKGKLPMPVEGNIVGKFGSRTHPSNPNLHTESAGIEIQTTENAAVKCVYEGTVVRVTFKPGFNNIVLVQHGNYYTFYANLKSTLVKAGDTVKQGEMLGYIGTKNNKNELHFQLWQNDAKLDPEKWLRY
jgi:murein hydrolase activator